MRFGFPSFREAISLHFGILAEVMLFAGNRKQESGSERALTGAEQSEPHAGWNVARNVPLAQLKL